MKRLAAALVAALLLAGCGAVPPPDNNAKQSDNYKGSNFVEVPIKLSDGRNLLCVQYFGNSAAFSCDWEHAK